MRERGEERGERERERDDLLCCSPFPAPLSSLTLYPLLFTLAGSLLSSRSQPRAEKGTGARTQKKETNSPPPARPFPSKKKEKTLSQSVCVALGREGVDRKLPPPPSARADGAAAISTSTGA